MKALFTFLTVIVLVVALAGAAHATTFMWTAPLSIDSGQYVKCSVANVSIHPIVVSVEAFDDAGTSQGAVNGITLNPHQTVGVNLSTALTTICKFTVPSAAYVRANACFSNFGSNSCLTEADAR
jgi:hypothetical protein